MVKVPFENQFTIVKDLPTPVYAQLVQAVMTAIEGNLLKKGDKMPSINHLSDFYKVSRATIEKSYSDLREMGILGSHQGKGYFIEQTCPSQELKILVLFNKINSYKKIVYDSFVEAIGPEAGIDFCVYHNSAAHFSHLLEKKQQNYSHYIIMPHFIDEASHAYKLIERLPKNKLILLDKNIREISGDVGAVYENYASDIFNALTQLLEHLKKYRKINLILPNKRSFPQEISEGFVKFCDTYSFSYKIKQDVTSKTVKRGEAYIVIPDDQMMMLLNQITDQNLVPGKDIGVVSYNENSSKKLIMNGLTTISTDFKAMGKSAAQMVLSGSRSKIENPFYLTLRSSV